MHESRILCERLLIGTTNESNSTKVPNSKTTSNKRISSDHFQQLSHPAARTIQSTTRRHSPPTLPTNLPLHNPFLVHPGLPPALTPSTPSRSYKQQRQAYRGSHRSRPGNLWPDHAGMPRMVLSAKASLTASPGLLSLTLCWSEPARG